MSGVLISFGHGYSAQALSQLLLPLGWQIYGTTRSPEKVDALAQTGIKPVLWPERVSDLPLDKATHLLTSAMPGESGDPVLARLGREIAACVDHLEWVGYLSTTAVYGDTGGEWVDEATPPAPISDRAIRRVMAEAEWGSIPGLPLHVFRLAGIYGPGRGPFSKVRNGTARRIIKPGQVFSRIHVDDIAQVLAASIQAPNPGAIYNVCDDYPAPPQDVIAHAAELLSMPVPPSVPFEKANLGPMARSFYGESRRVRNTRLKDELGVQLKYPDYRAGLAALRANEE